MGEQRNQDPAGTDQPGSGSSGSDPATPEPAGPATQERPRPPRTVPAMLFSMLPLVLIAFGVAGLVGQCSFSPLGPTIDRGAVPTVDVDAKLRDAAGQVDFPVFEPRFPDQWRANSASTTSLDPATHVVRVGWLTASTHYLRISQSTAPEEALVGYETKQPPRAEGTIQAGGRQWVIYRGVRSEKAWVGERDGVRILITGSGDEAEFRTVADALARAPAL